MLFFFLNNKVKESVGFFLFVCGSASVHVSSVE